MKRTLRSSIPFFALALVSTAATITPPGTLLRIDPAQTKVEFTLADVLHTVHGTFQLKRGDLRFDPSAGSIGGELVVDAASGDSGSGARDRRMNKNVLECGRFPEIVFRPARLDGKVAPQGMSHVSIHGTFAIHGGEHEIDIPADIDASDGRYSATLKFAVPYAKWGMKNPSTLFLRVSDQVDITIHTVAAAAQ